MEGKIYISKEKLASLKKELKGIEDVKRKEIAESLEEARALGDLKENAEYHKAREDQGILESRVLEINNIIKNHEIFKERHTDEVEIGSIVTISKKNLSKKITYTIVGEEDIDIENNKIPHHSPIAIAMLSKKEGDMFKLTKPSGDVINYKIENIK